MMTLTCPKCGSTKIENDECLRCGVYVSKYLAYLQKRGAASVMPASAPAAAPPGPMDDLGYRIVGDDIQFVEVELEPGQGVVAEPGALLYMDTDIAMETTAFGAAAGGGGLLGRVLAGESIFVTSFTNAGTTKRRVAFAAFLPGKILAIRLPEIGGELLAQKGVFLAGARGLSIGIAFQKKLGAGLLGGAGFILERLEGDGMVFVAGAGGVVERELGAGETVRVQTGCVVAFERTVIYDVEYVGSIKSALFGGQGLVFATLTGPGRIWLQSPALAHFARSIAPRTQSGASATHASGGVLGGWFGGSKRDDESESGDSGGVANLFSQSDSDSSSSDNNP